MWWVGGWWVPLRCETREGATCAFSTHYYFIKILFMEFFREMKWQLSTEHWCFGIFPLASFVITFVCSRCSEPMWAQTCLPVSFIWRTYVHNMCILKWLLFCLSIIISQSSRITLPILVNVIPSGVVKSFNVTTLLGLTALLVTLTVAAVRMTSRETSRHKQTSRHTNTHTHKQTHKQRDTLLTHSSLDQPDFPKLVKAKTLQLINNCSLIRPHPPPPHIHPKRITSADSAFQYKKICGKSA